jgi:tetratricopeptide (TPR) repeat protein
MALFDLIVGWQSWPNYVSNRDLASLFEKSLVKTGDRLALQLPAADRDAAVAEGLGSIENLLASGLNDLSYEVRELSAGIDGMRADFHILMGDVVWRLETQTAALSNILRTLQSPLDTAAKELRARAEDAYRNGWYEEALADFLHSAENNYQDFAVHRSIGNIYLYHLVDLARATDYFQKAAKYARPRDRKQASEAEFFAGIALGLQQEYERALKHMIEAICLNESFYEARYLAASFAGLLGRVRAVCENLELAMRGDPRYYERFKHDRFFDGVREEVDGYLKRQSGALIEGQRRVDALIDLFYLTLDELRPQVGLAEEKSRWHMLVHLASDIKSIRRQVDYNDYSALRGAASRICDALELSQTCGVPTLDQADKATSEHELPSPAILAQRLIMSWKWKQPKYQ